MERHLPIPDILFGAKICILAPSVVPFKLPWDPDVWVLGIWPKFFVVFFIFFFSLQNEALNHSIRAPVGT